jgi:plastocyanin
MLTSVDFVGTKSFVLTLHKGVYRYFCDPHSLVMHGSFRVV